MSIATAEIIRLPSRPASDRSVKADGAKVIKLRSRKSVAVLAERNISRPHGDDGPWLWVGYVNPATGYGEITYHCPFRGELIRRNVHRALMEATLGRKLERQEYVLHNAGTSRLDVNPAHMHIGTHAENIREAAAAGSIGKHRLNRRQVKRIAQRFQNGATRARLAKDYRVTVRCIHQIVTGYTHSDVTGIKYAPNKMGQSIRSKVEVPRQRSGDIQTLGAAA